MVINDKLTCIFILSELAVALQIWLFKIFILKIHGQGHACGQRCWPWKLKVNVIPNGSIWAVNLPYTCSLRSVSKGENKPWALINCPTSTACIAAFLEIIWLKFWYYTPKGVFLTGTKLQSDTVSHCSVVTESNLHYKKDSATIFTELHARTPPVLMPGWVDKRIGQPCGPN